MSRRRAGILPYRLTPESIARHLRRGGTGDRSFSGKRLVCSAPPAADPLDPSSSNTLDHPQGREGGNFPETSGRPYMATLPISLSDSWTIDTSQTSQGQQFPGIAYSELPLPGKDPNDFKQAQTATVQWTQGSDTQGTLTISGMTGGPTSGIGVGAYQAAWMQVDVQVWATQPAAAADSEGAQVVSPLSSDQPGPLRLYHPAR